MSDEDDILETNAAFYRALDNLDIDALDLIMANEEPIRVVHPGWSLVSGREAVMESWSRIFDNAGMMQFIVQDPEAHIEGDFAWVECVERLTSVQGGRVVEGFVQTTNLFRKEAGRWLMVHHHGSPVG